jgi:large subunit ribosomal protein L22
MATLEQEQTVRAQARWVHSSARKARLVTDLIRGRSVPEARTILAFSQRAVARDVEKVLKSAVANAESRPDLHWNGDDLVIAAAFADEGPTLKRWRARARGRVARIRKRTCHITIELTQVRVVAAAAPAAPATRKTSAQEVGSPTPPAATTPEQGNEEPTAQANDVSGEEPKATRRKKKSEES